MPFICPPYDAYGRTPSRGQHCKCSSFFQVVEKVAIVPQVRKRPEAMRKVTARSFEWFSCRCERPMVASHGYRKLPEAIWRKPESNVALRLRSLHLAYFLHVSGYFLIFPGISYYLSIVLDLSLFLDRSWYFVYHVQHIYFSYCYYIVGTISINISWYCSPLCAPAFTKLNNEPLH